MKRILTIYHKGCIDGTTAAAVMLRKFPQVVFFPLANGYTAEDLEPVFLMIDNETEIYTVDCGSGVRELLAKGFKVTTLDHHIGVKDSLDLLVKENPNFTYIFDNEKSGASLAWQYFFTDEELPELIKLVEDSDLWKGQFGDDTKNVNNYLWMFVNDPQSILKIMEGSLDEVKMKGEVISNYSNKEILEQVELPSLDIKIGGYIVPAYNITTHVSACGNILSEKNNQTAVMFTIKGDVVKFSFRSKENQTPSALDLAKILGGSGHVNAAGARVTLKEFIAMLA
jgi:oligoribonuclease NrnB/cAMP/cGMP phosphodiesterase (DHH superfamily)